MKHIDIQKPFKKARKGKKMLNVYLYKYNVFIFFWGCMYLSVENLTVNPCIFKILVKLIPNKYKKIKNFIISINYIRNSNLFLFTITKSENVF